MLEDNSAATIRIFDSVEEIVESLALSLKSLADECVKENRNAHISLSGGSTPKYFFKFLLESPYKFSIQWDYLHFWWGDERSVAPEHVDSNYGEASRLLLRHIDIPPENIHRIQGETLVEKEVLRFSDEMTKLMPVENGRPQFDWVILGMGNDGHTASLFPAQTDYETDLDAVAVFHPETQQPRISITAPVISNAKRVSYLVLGKSKQEMVKRCLAMLSDVDTCDYPAARIHARAGETQWYLDHDAAALLTEL
mgnify:CR=1 FL=1